MADYDITLTSPGASPWDLTLSPTPAIPVYYKKIWLKVHGQWKQGIIWKRVDGAWKAGEAYLKVDGEWL